MNSTKERIFKAAISTFSKSGFYKSTMDEIAESANVAKGTLYYHFKSKNEILEFLIDEGLKVLKNEVSEKIDKLNNAVEKLRTVIFIQSDFLYKYGDFITVLLSQIWGNNKVQDKFREKLYDYLKIIEDIIKEGISEKLIVECDEKIVSSVFFGMISSILVLKLRNKENFDPGYIADNILKYTLNGIQYVK
ncbi:TetR/AcrR family transcriptional regulator [Aceticella autotrophica]|uniref:TetR/AcrR family transcriptional regulator n=1 Tax=Aceticella autotrophica TaxID=2755338 RepID=A0A975AWQ9_9THEO|nr:TetR/AcrR family transcriptional regulator [Aceticella autotrophica]QSZ27793.1 TetR/AcrR family transcriptional regulator [Aceticella autotrophica]